MTAGAGGTVSFTGKFYAPNGVVDFQSNTSSVTVTDIVAGKIVNITSVAGRTGSRGMAAYAAAKAGVTALTQSLGAEWAKYGITVNAVAPGPTATEGVLEVWKTEAMIAQAAREVPLQRLGRPEEVAWAVIFLASDRANFITGETLYVSGGPRVSNRED